MHALRHIDRRLVASAAAALLVLGVVATSPQLLGERVEAALGTMAAASPGLLWLAGACYVGMLTSMALAWRAGIRALDGDLDTSTAAASYAVGSLVTALFPFGAGGAARIALFGRALRGHERLWQAGGVAAVVSAARALVLTALILLAAPFGAFPRWPAIALAVAGGVALVTAWVARRHPDHRGAAHFVDVFGSLTSRPRIAATLLGSVLAATLFRAASAAAVASALGVRSPVTVGLIAVAALAVSGIVQVTPGNLGVGSGALVLALGAQGVGMGTALSFGIALQTLESALGILLGAGGLVYLARLRLPEWSLRLAGAGAVVALAGAFGLTVLA